MLKMIKNKDFYVLLLGRLITNFGDSLYAIASTLLVYKMTGSTIYSGITLFLTSSTAIVQLLLSPILDRINMKKFLILSQLIQAILILIIPFLYKFGKLSVYHIMVIMPIISLINQLVYPGQISLLPKILSEKELVRGNSLMTMAYQGSNAIFDTLAGFIISIFGFMTAFFADSISFILTGILFCLLSKKLSHSKKRENNFEENILKNHFKSLKEGLNLFKDSKIFALVFGIVFINFAATSISAVLPAFTQNEIFYSLMLAGMGAGLLLGSLFAGFPKLKEIPLGKLYIYGMMIVALAWICLSNFQNNIKIGVVLYGLGWFVVGLVNVYAQTMVQIIVPNGKLGSAMGAMVGISTFMAPLGALFGGFLGEYLSSSMAIFIGSFIIFLVAIFWALNENIRKLPSVNNIHKNY
ncbi:transporter, major facilitator family protein [Anaerococcus hydrogenalis DSM 7454]|uniref:Transporter, major facilitator family protein n=1 Tax=Anaerococcus hydrogenalis DSM 7454 TaxID=561177 RepID=B6W8V7_9FIRM|nr:MFS transporter [Anaerococcus hydrogenalis]EEB36170.1 transporter, major facilitator family protein [Anaerococcus hydrogenalis DSM 7454]